jgi:hypothetical protein
MSIFKLGETQFKKLISDCNLDKIIVPQKNLGVTVDDYYKPFSNQIFLKNVYKDYIQREEWFEKYVLRLKSIDFIIWSEASRVGNNQYIYHLKEDRKFKFENNSPGYFKNVKELVFENSLVIDFLSPFGINHSAYTRNEFYKLLCNNRYYWNYFIDYYNSIINTLSFKLNYTQNIIVAPGNTKKLILNFIKEELKITIDIKSYDIDDRGAKQSFVYL